MVFSAQAKYIYICRDGRDIVWSLYNHHANANDLYYQALNETPNRVGPPLEPPPDSCETYFHDWLEGDGYPFWSFWENIRTWWDIRNLPNVKLIHFANLKADMPGEIRRIADFLEIPIEEDKWDNILEHCSFEYMKRNAPKSVPLGGAFWHGGAKTFIHKGVNGRWHEELSRQESEAYEKKALSELGPDCSNWLSSGGFSTGKL